MGQGGWRTWFGAINIAKKIIANEECLELQFLGEVIGRGEFERGLSSNIDANESLVWFIGVVDGCRVRFGSHAR